MSEEISISLFALQLTILVLCVLATVIFFLQRRLSPAFGMSSLVFLTLAVSNLPATIDAATPGTESPLPIALIILCFAAAFFIAPLLLFQMRLLVGKPIVANPRRLIGHLIFPCFAVLCCLVLTIMLTYLRHTTDVATLTTEPVLMWSIVIAALFLLGIGVNLQLIGYAVAIFVEHRQYRKRLRDVFASTEKHEMLWVALIAGLICLYSLQSLANLISVAIDMPPPVSTTFDRAIVLLAITILTIRGLRQTPGLYQEHSVSPDEAAVIAEKYAKSALDADHADRLARKLRMAMTVDHLYRDPNLSLAKLSQHVGSSPNYVSQTLNEHVAQSFFDFVNMWRIEEAKPMVLEGRLAVVSIAYEVGFNSRSAFYSAFKKHVGQTPSQYKQKTGNARRQSLERATAA